MQNTIKQRTGALSASALVFGLIAAVSQVSAAPTTGIAGTRHNLGTTNRDLATGLTSPSDADVSVGRLYTSGTDEICVFCHTPHASNTAANAPLWNKALPNSSGYSLYQSGTMQGSASFTSSSMSLVCLSCHDGTQAMDNMFNQPGGGGYNAAGARLAGTWYEGNTATALNDGKITDQPYMRLGTDLSNDHPVGIPYCGGGLVADTTAGTTSGTCNDGDFNGVGTGANNSSFVVGTTGTTKEKMRLYNNGSGGLTVECGSCHDPHNSTNKTFLRISNSGSAVCLTCHNK